MNNPKLMSKATLKIRDYLLDALLALSEEEQSNGLMHFSQPIPPMAFLYKQAKLNKFWMHNVNHPLDIIFCRGGKIMQICYGKAYSTELLGPEGPSDLVIELPAGSCKMYGLNKGDDVSISLPKKVADQLLF